MPFLVTYAVTLALHPRPPLTGLLCCVCPMPAGSPASISPAARRRIRPAYALWEPASAGLGRPGAASAASQPLLCFHILTKPFSRNSLPLTFLQNAGGCHPPLANSNPVNNSWRPRFRFTRLPAPGPKIRRPARVDERPARRYNASPGALLMPPGKAFNVPADEFVSRTIHHHPCRERGRPPPGNPAKNP